MKNYILAIMYSVILSMVSVTAIANQDPNSEDVYKSPEYIAAVAAFDSKEFHKAITLLTPFAEQGTRGAQFALTQIYGKSGDPEFANPNKAFKWHKIGALNGVMWSQYWMGHHYRILDADEAYRWYLMAANQGHTHSQLMVGALQMGSGLIQKYEPADYLHWFTLAAESGDVDAIAIVGDIYYYGDLGEPDYDKALEWYLKIASEDEADPEVIFKIGEFHRYGYAGKINYNLTRIWYERAANRGHDIAQFNLAELYFEGDANGGVDYARAFKWYEKSSKLNNSEATAMLGMMYELGLGVDLDLSKALSFYQDAANAIDSVKPDLERVKKTASLWL